MTHAPARGATTARTFSSATSWFQPTRPRGARRAQQWISVQLPRFQPTRPRGARPRHFARIETGTVVSTHAPARGATVRARRAGRRPRVSTHAPARGATVGQELAVVGGAHVSTHAPARGATSSASTARTRAHRFNPRAREGRDRRRCTDSSRGSRFQPTRPRGARHVGDSGSKRDV